MNTIIEPAREVKVINDVDIVVLGGSCTGVFAAVRAARLGAKVAIVEAAGAFAVTLECVPAELAAEITASLAVPTVGIGAGPVCDAQWLVMHDLLGLNEKVPSFVKKYADLATTVRGAFAAYVKEVADGTFPNS